MNNDTIDETHRSLTIPGLPFPSRRNLGKAVLGLILYGILFLVPDVASSLMEVPAFMLDDSEATHALLAAADIIGGDMAGFIWKVLLLGGLVYWLADAETLRDGFSSHIIPVTVGFVGVMYGTKLLGNLPDIIGFVTRGFAAPEGAYLTGMPYLIREFYLPSFLVHVTVIALAVVIVLTGQIQRDCDYLDALLQIGLVGYVLGGIQRLPRSVSRYISYRAEADGPSAPMIAERVFDSGLNSTFEAVVLAVAVFAAFLLTKHLYDTTPVQPAPDPDPTPTEAQEAVES